MIGAEAVVSGIRGRTELRGISGDSTLVGLSGVVRAETVSGSLEAQTVTGDLRFQSVSGDLTVVEGAGTSVRAESVTGAMVIDLDSSPEPTDIRLTSVSGEIAIRLPHPADAKVEANTASGTVSNAFEDLRVGGQWGAKKITGTLGAGTGKLKATTVSGSIALLQPWPPRTTRMMPSRPERCSDMAPVFAHGRLRLYLLKLLDEAPRHGYEVIRLLEERFQGLYAPSAGTVYPRLAKLEAEGLVTHATEGGRKVYSITEAGRAELAGRGGELADLELEIRESVSELAAEIRDDVRGAAYQLRSEMRAAASESRQTSGGGRSGWDPGFGEKEAWSAAKEELRKAKQEWKEQARRAKDESRKAREDAEQARRQAQEAHEKAREQVQNAARQVQEHFARGDW